MSDTNDLPPATRPPAEADTVEAVAELLAHHGYRFVPDERLPEMRRALRPFLTTPTGVR